MERSAVAAENVKYKIIQNSALCLNCNTEIISRHRHDFKWCECGNLAVDGGKDYIKRSGGHLGGIKETSIVKEVKDD